MVVAGFGCATAVSQKKRTRAKIQYDIAVVEMNRGDMRQALRDLLVSVEFDPDLPQARNALGLVYHALGHTDEALLHYERAVSLKPDFSKAYNNMGILLMDLGRYDQAIVAFETALGDILYPTPSLAEGNLGWARYSKGDVEAGIRNLRNAVATSPKFCRGYEWLARIGLDTDAAELVIANCARFDKYCLKDKVIAAKLPPAYVDQMSYYCGLGHLKAGDREAARAAFSTCAKGEGTAAAEKCSESLQAMP